MVSSPHLGISRMCGRNGSNESNESNESDESDESDRVTSSAWRMTHKGFDCLKEKKSLPIKMKKAIRTNRLPRSYMYIPFTSTFYYKT